MGRAKKNAHQRQIEKGLCAAGKMTLGSHQQTIGKSQDHLTPRWIIDALGPFDLDPCGSLHGSPCANHVIRPPADGLALRWPPEMLVWLNPPFDRYQVAKWI